MKQIFALRHSKAGQTNKKLTDDHERPLTQKGVELCEQIAENLTSLSVVPQVIICSTSRRTKQTADNLLEQLKQDIPVYYSSKLYLASVEDIYDEIHGLSDEIDNVLLLGHNPGLQLFCMSVSGMGSKNLYRDMKNHFPPGALAQFELDIASWVEVAPRAAKLEGYLNPKKS
ncbi:MAG: histidine phosphatase family protein [Hyphomicrobiales bacterium]|nr:histidine phosphatase family protein [Hyphomicrobiales bacterium]